MLQFRKTLAMLCSLAILSGGFSMLPASAEETPSLHIARTERQFLMTASETLSASSETYTLPESFDLRQQGLVSPVKNQGEYGTCWAFASLNSLETNEIGRNPHVDYSEWYQAHYAYQGESGYPYWSENLLDEGGNANQVIGMLMNWVGPVSEENYPYYGETPDPEKPLKELQKESLLHVTDFHYFGMRFSNTNREQEIQQVKQAIYEGHSIYFATGFAAIDDAPFRNYEYQSFYVPDNYYDYVEEDFSPGAHAMSIVGWDDNFPAEQFSIQPDRDGAWLVKNSWGESFGDGGYLWISYEDSFIGDMIYFDTEDAHLHDHLYEYDDFAGEGAFAVSSSLNDKSAYISNIFTAEEDEDITDIMLNCVNVDDNYEIQIYTGLTDAGNPVSGEASGTTSGTLKHLGYQTLSLDAPVTVKKGELFSVVVKLTGSAGCHIPCELAWKDDGTPVGSGVSYSSPFSGFSSINYEMLHRNFHENESFFSSDGKTWHDIYHHTEKIEENMAVGNICLRALGVSHGTVHFSDYHEEIPFGTEISLSSPEQAAIYYAINDGEYQLYTEPITISEEMTISAYADTGEEHQIFSQHYAQQKADLSSLMIYHDFGSEYIGLWDSELSDVTICYGEADAFCLPVSSGTITCNGEVIPSGEKYTLDTAQSDSDFYFTIEQEGCLPSEYHLHIRNNSYTPVANGIWEGFDYDGNPVAYQFHDGTGIFKNLTDGTVKEFNYRMTGANTYEFSDSGSNWTEMLIYQYNTDTEYPYLSITDNVSGKGAELTRISENLFDMCPVYSNDELCEAMLQYYEDLTGERPASASVRMCEGNTPYVELFEMIDNQFVKLGNGYYCDRNGSCYDESGRRIVYSTVDGDVNNDYRINALDASVLLTESARIGAGEEESFSPAQKHASDLNHDISVNASDAAVLLKYCAAVGAGEDVKLSDFS
ncbi:MAG: hypothetical protein IJJ69_14810 [Oscillospiraceae bacterium]|nr:hypothetical protein [Oscillospiraceae bacterium]